MGKIVRHPNSNGRRSRPAGVEEDNHPRTRPPQAPRPPRQEEQRHGEAVDPVGKDIHAYVAVRVVRGPKRQAHRACEYDKAAWYISTKRVPATRMTSSELPSCAGRHRAQVSSPKPCVSCLPADRPRSRILHVPPSPLRPVRQGSGGARSQSRSLACAIRDD